MKFLKLFVFNLFQRHPKRPAESITQGMNKVTKILDLSERNLIPVQLLTYIIMKSGRIIHIMLLVSSLDE